MENPWLELPAHAPYILDVDHAIVATFNESAAPAHQMHLDLWPEPFIGNPTAPIVLLNLNPGFSEDDHLYHHDNAAFAQASRANLMHSDRTYPFHLLDPQFRAASGAQWWRRKLRRLLESYGEVVISNAVCVIEYFPYHSTSFQYKHLVSSQRYNFHLVNQAIQRDAIIVSMRSETLWRAAVPALAGYHRYYRVHNPQNPAISGRNCPEGYQAIIAQLDTFFS